MFVGNNKVYNRCMSELPDILALIPDTPPRRVIQFCLDDLHLSVEESSQILYDATRLMQAVNLLLRGSLVSEDSESPLL